MPTKTTIRFKELVRAQDILLMPVPHDPLCARIAEQTGFQAVCAAGYASSAALLGQPDIGLLTLTEMVDCAKRIIDAVSIPVFVDGDTGHGGIPNVMRTVKLLEGAGAAGLFLEDQIFPKRCGHMQGKQIIPASEMVVKLKAALDARTDPDFMIMARTDAVAVNGFDAALERALLYQEAGADMIFVEAPESIEQMRRINAEISVPTMANMLPGGKTPLLSAKELQDMGFAIAAHPTVCTHAIAKTVQEVLTTLRQTGSTVGLENRMMTFDAFKKLVGLEELRDKEAGYSRS